MITEIERTDKNTRNFSSEILDYKLILFRSGHFDRDIMEKI